MPRRLTILLTVVAVAAPLLVLTTPARAARPTLTAGKAVSGRAVVLTGAGPRRAEVVLERRSKGRWTTERTIRAARDGRFRLRVRATLGRQRYRAVIGGRATRAVSVDPTPAVERTADGYSLRGRLPVGPRRTVLLQRRDGAAWTTVATGSAKKRFELRWTPAAASTVRILAPRRKRKRTVYPAIASPAVRLDVDRTAPTDPVDPTDPTDPEDPEHPADPEQLTFSDLTPSQDKHSTQPDVSADGRYVAFLSNARLVDADANLSSDVYVHDRVSGTTTLVSKHQVTGAAIGATDPAISADGRSIAFVTTAAVLAGDAALPQLGQIYLYDRQADVLTRVTAVPGSSPNGDSWGRACQRTASTSRSPPRRPTSPRRPTPTAYATSSGAT